MFGFSATDWVHVEPGPAPRISHCAGADCFGEPTKLHLLAIGPELNRQVLGNPAVFRTTGQFIRGPENSAQRRIRYGLTRMTGDEHKGRYLLAGRS
jgi:hypothetical protein